MLTPIHRLLLSHSAPPALPDDSHLLFESASGYALFEVKLHDEIANSTKQFQDSIADLHKFGKMVSLKSFAPFTSAGHALENANDVSEGALLSLWPLRRACHSHVHFEDRLAFCWTIVKGDTDETERVAVATLR